MRVTRASLTSLAADLNVTTCVAIVTLLSLVLPRTPLSQLAASVGPVLLAGSVVASRLRPDVPTSHRIAVMLTTGLFSIIAIQGIVGWVLPQISVGAPLSGAPIVLAMALLAFGCAGWAIVAGRDPVRGLFDCTTTRQWLWATLLGLLPIVSLIGVAEANQGTSAGLAIVVALVALGLVVAAIALPVSDRTPPRVLLLASALVTLAVQLPLRGGWLLGGDLAHEQYIAALAIQQGRFPLAHFVDPYGAMLSLTTWPAALHEVTGLSLVTILGLVPSLVLAVGLFPIWAVVRELTGPRPAAAICAVFVVATPGIINPLPEISRQCFALAFLSLLVLALFSRKLPVRQAQALAICGGIGVAATHYSSGFVVVGVVGAAWVASMLLREPRSERVITLPVAGVIAGFAAIWEVKLARANSNVTQVVKGFEGKPPPPVKHPHQHVLPPGSPTPLSIVLIGLALVLLVVFVVIVTRSIRTRHLSVRASATGLAAVVGAAVIGAFGVSRWPTANADAEPARHTLLSLLRSATASTAITAHQLRHRDFRLHLGKEVWMHLGRAAYYTVLHNDPVPTGKAVVILSPTIALVQAVSGKIALLVALASVVVCIWFAFRERRWAEVAGVGAFAVVISAIWRDSQTIVTYFGPVRIQAETYPIFAATTALSIALLRPRLATAGWLSQPRATRTALWAVGAVVAATMLAGAIGLSNLITRHAPLGAAYSARGQQIQTVPTTSDRLAAKWLAAALPTGLVQSDFAAQAILFTVGWADRLEYIPSVDPILTDNRSWILASRNNVVSGRAFGGSTTYQALFRFPYAYFATRRSVLYSSDGAVVFGSTPATRRPVKAAP